MTCVWPRQWLSLAYCLLSFSATCAPTFADPLTLEAALATAESSHPDVLYAQAERDRALAETQFVDARRDANVTFEGILRSGRPSFGNTDFTGDNSVRLTVRKNLYDFGRSNNAELAAQYELSARESDLITMVSNRRLEIMARYSDVLLADMSHTVESELTSVYYTTFQHGKDRLELGQISTVDLAELESRYRDTVEKRSASAQRQRLSRLLLANAMNRPNDVPTDVEDPKLLGNQRTLPEYESLLSILLTNNPRLVAQQEMLAASQKRIEFLRAENGPILDAEVQAADYSRSAITRDNISAGVIFSWPLYQGNLPDSRVAKEVAEFNKLQASAGKLRMELTQALLESYLEITELQSAARSAANTYTDYRDLLLERSRGYYELELASNLGTSMAGTAEATMRARQIEYRLALSFARLEALIGRPLSESGLR